MGQDCSNCCSVTARRGGPLPIQPPADGHGDNPEAEGLPVDVLRESTKLISKLLPSTWSRALEVGQGDGEPSSARSQDSVGAVASQTYFGLHLEELKSLDPNQSIRGTFVFKDGATYLGQWRGNTRHGVGMMRWPDGAVYKGQWRDNRADGKGQLQHSSGDVYCGEWRGNLIHGVGVYCHRNANKEVTYYKGEWRNDMQHGHGVETWAQHCEYEGEFKAGCKDGFGVYTWPDSSTFEGKWSQNHINGPGLYVGKDGREFRGQWRSSQIHGAGRYAWADGREYRGQYSGGQKSGFGELEWPDGRKYQGYWSSKQHGLGVFFKADGVPHAGMWKNGKLEEELDFSKDRRFQ